MKFTALFSASLLALWLVVPAFAEQRPDHYQGKAAETIEDAVANFREYNNRLAALVNKGALSDQDLSRIHEMTYTLENALEKIREELEDLADVLEEVHVASETADADRVKSRGRAYLETAGQIVRH